MHCPSRLMVGSEPPACTPSALTDKRTAFCEHPGGAPMHVSIKNTSSSPLLSSGTKPSGAEKVTKRRSADEEGLLKIPVVMTVVEGVQLETPAHVSRNARPDGPGLISANVKRSDLDRSLHHVLVGCSEPGQWCDSKQRYRLLARYLGPLELAPCAPASPTDMR